jgi:hypothetical protein
VTIASGRYHTPHAHITLDAALHPPPVAHRRIREVVVRLQRTRLQSPLHSGPLASNDRRVNFVRSTLARSFTARMSAPPSSAKGGGSAKDPKFYASNGRLRVGGAMTKCDAADSLTEQSWCNVSGTTFETRIGPDYQQHKKKQPSAPCIYEVRTTTRATTTVRISHLFSMLRGSALWRIDHTSHHLACLHVSSCVSCVVCGDRFVHDRNEDQVRT